MTKMTREQWLTTVLHKHVAPLLAAHGATVPADCKVSVGFPGGGSARKRIGECWPRSRSSQGVNEIFLNPVMRTPFTLVDVLVHEAIHAADDCKSGHKGFFRRVAKSVGLEGKMTATHAGAELAKWINETLAAMPAFDYGSLTLDGAGKQKNRHMKLECSACGAVWRMSNQWFQLATRCPCCGEDL